MRIFICDYCDEDITPNEVQHCHCHINFNGQVYRRHYCPECREVVKRNFKDFIDMIKPKDEKRP